MEVTPLTKWAFRSARGLTGGLAFLLMGALATVALSGCWTGVVSIASAAVCATWSMGSD